MFLAIVAIYQNVMTGKVIVTSGAREISIAFRRVKSRFTRFHTLFHKNMVKGSAVMISCVEFIILGINLIGLPILYITWVMKLFIKSVHMETADQTEIRIL